MPTAFRPTVNAPTTDLPATLVLLLASGAGLAVATLYYNQPMLGVLGSQLAGRHALIGWIPSLTQFGYALGLLFLAPLGDRYDRRRIILIKSAALALALLGAGIAPDATTLLWACVPLGLAATMAQDIVPAAAALAPAQHRGRVIGMVMTGLLLGILLSRVVAGLVAEHFGWRVMFLAASASIVMLTLALWRGLPTQHPVVRVGYGELLGSLAVLWQRHAALRRAALAQSLLAIGFSAFWSTLAVMLHAEPFKLGAGAAGAFGLAGAAGALAAPFAGRLVDRFGPARLVRFTVGLAAASFAAMGLLPLLGPNASLALLALTAIGFDLGVQASLICHQSIIYGLDPEARSRLNAVLMVSLFIGMTMGSSLGNLALQLSGWGGVTVLATGAAVLALLVRLWPGPAQSAALSSEA